MIDTSDKYLLMIEFNEWSRPSEPIEDELTEKIKYIYERTVMPEPERRYRGYHSVKLTDDTDGEHVIQRSVMSDNADHYLPNGVITHSMCVYYVRCFRKHIPESEIKKIHKYYKMCKKKPKKLWKKEWERSVYKPFKIRKYVVPTTAERIAEQEKWEKKHKERREREEREYAERKKNDKRSRFWKETMERAGVEVKY